MASKPVAFFQSYGTYDAATRVYTPQTHEQWTASLVADIERALASMGPIDLTEPLTKAEPAPESKTEPVPEAKAPQAKPEAKEPK